LSSQPGGLTRWNSWLQIKPIRGNFVLVRSLSDLYLVCLSICDGVSEDGNSV